MKRIIFFLFILPIHVSVVAQNNENYIETNVMQVPNITNAQSAPMQSKQQTIQYFDGLGRPMQTVMTQGSPALKDIVSPVVYDEFGREKRKYLPFVANETNGWYKVHALLISVSNHDYQGLAATFYNNPANKIADDGNKPYAETVFENSPLNRVIEQGAPGAPWQPDATNSYSSSDRTIKRAYEINGTGEVLKWTVSGVTTSTPFGQLSASSAGVPVYYAPNTLYRNKIKDEQHNEVIEYVDKEGRVVLKRVQAVAGSPAVNDTNYASTYYIYDDFGRLACVIQPEGVKRLATEYHNASSTDKETFLQRWTFRYAYDARMRLTHKQVPGAQAVYMIYDNRDRLVLTQDGNLRSTTTKYWLFIKYDRFNRIAMTGTYQHNGDYETVKSAVDGYYTTLGAGQAWFETYIGAAGGNVLGYNNASFPQITTAARYLTISYYDTYDTYITPTGFAYQADTGLAGHVSAVLNPPIGLPTVSLVRNLAAGTWMRTVNYYDPKQRVVQTIAEHQKGTVKTNLVYDFPGKLLRSKRIYTVNSAVTTILETYQYDRGGRLLMTWHQIGNNSPVLLAKNEYNELGQLVVKSLGAKSNVAPVFADPSVGKPGVVYSNNIETSSYTPSEPTYIASGSIRFLPGFTVSSGQSLNARIGYSEQDASTYNNNITYTVNQQVDYRYNIRGWMTKINEPAAPANDLFSMELRYNDPTANGGTAQFNGNISEALWKTAGLEKQSYGYSYDAMNRLTKGAYYNLEETSQNGRYQEKIGEVSLDRPAYDLNGNILNLFRNGKITEGTYSAIDDLHYEYTAGGNKLGYVTDNIATNANEQGFKEISTGESTTDYAYDDNGNLIKDENKGIIGIEYNYLNLPSKVSRSATEYVIYTYDAAGRKLAQQVFGPEAKTTDYIGELILENNNLQAILHAEGRVVSDQSVGAPDPWEYEYFLKDHLGNVRTTFSEKKTMNEYKATMENNTQAAEAAAFNNYYSGVRSGMPLFDHTDAGSVYTYSQLLNGGSNSQVGLAKSFAVDPGDVFDLEVYAKYEAPGSTGNNVNTLLAQLVSAFSLGAGSTPLDGAQAQTAFNSLFSAGPWITSSKWESAPPKAYLNYILFDESFTLVDFGFDQISTSALQSGASPVVPHDYLSLHVRVKQKGFLYVYVSNEQPVVTNVYFDDLKIVKFSAVKQVEDYYPFGLVFNSYNSENSLPQDYKFNGKEQQTELDLGWMDYGLRMYQPELGRWNGVDPLAEEYFEISPFVYVANNPTLFIDPNGAEIWLSFTYRNENDKEVTSRYQYKNGKLYNENGDEYDGSDGADPVFQLVKDQLNATMQEFGNDEDISNMFSFLESEESGQHTINIQFSGENRTSGSGKKTAVYYNPLNWEEPDDFDKDKKGKRDPRIGLTHELKHSYDHAKGRDPMADVDWTYEDTGEKRMYSQFEARALNIENILRKALYGKTRETYTVKDESGKIRRVRPPKRYVRD